MRRLSLGLTQTKVAQAINVTFQQIQKYEKGTNGVSSNRLMQLSQFLKVPIIYFFEDFNKQTTKVYIFLRMSRNSFQLNFQKGWSSRLVNSHK